MSKVRDLLAQLAEELDDEEPLTLNLAAGEVTEIELARSGTFWGQRGDGKKGGVKVEITPAMLSYTAKNFDSARERKLKLGHDKIQTSTPDMGDFVALRHDAKADRLFASVKPTQSLVEKNQKGEFRRVSAELDPTPDGKNFLAGDIAFLGAHRPAVSGLSPVTLAAGEHPPLFVCMADAADEDEGGLDTRRKVQPDDDPDKTKEKTTMDEAAVAAAKKLEEEKTALETEKKQLLARLESEQARNVALAEGVVDKLIEEKLVKNQKFDAIKSGKLRAFLLAAFARDQEPEAKPIHLAAADGKGKPTEVGFFDLAKEVLLAFPPKLSKDDVTERVTEGLEDEELPGSDTRNLAGAEEGSVKQDQAAQKVMFAEKAKGNEISYIEALRRVELAQARK